MTKKELIGEFAIMGTNQDIENTAYKGILKLSLVQNQITAKWFINNEQEQFGTGFFKNNILVINFNYIGADRQKYTGTVVYQCITKDYLEGFWSEKHGNLNYLGKERCLRLITTEVLQ